MSNITILSLSTSPWSYPYWTSRQFLTYELAGLANVIYAVGRSDMRTMLTLSNLFGPEPAPPFAAPPGLEVLRSRWPKTYRYEGLDRCFFQAYVRRLQKQLDSGGHRVVYAWNPDCVETVRALSYDVLVYHPYDMFRHFANSADDLVSQENELCQLADVVVTPHGRVAQALGHPNTHVVNNGLFLPAFPDYQAVKPSEIIADLQRPVIGNLGVINDKIDFKLLLRVFSNRPEWQLAFVGFEGQGSWKQSDAYREIRSLDNVHFLGSVAIDKVAQVIAGFDVGIIPYSLSGWAQFIESPLKLYQYWAMGVPVVSSELPTLRQQPGALEVCHSADDWQSAIQKQLTQRDGRTRQALRTRAEENSWSAKAKEVVQLIRQTL